MPRKLTTAEFIEKAREIHGDKYDYLDEYVNTMTHMRVRCKKCGNIFSITPNNHLSKKQGCILCYLSHPSKAHNIDTWISLCKRKHNNFYLYDKEKLNYYNGNSIVNIICPKHGEFSILARHHLAGHKCHLCNIEKYRETHCKSTEQFISDARKVHGDKYDYSKVNYMNAHTKVCIICPTHGEFWQTPHKHLQGNACPHCNTSNLENEIKLFLTEQNIDFEQQKKFEWLGRQSLDFYLPKYNIGIECQGMQHFKAVEHFGGKQGFIDILERDVRKKKLCEEKNLKLLYFADKIYENADYQIFIDKFELLKEIIKK